MLLRMRQNFTMRPGTPWIVLYYAQAYLFQVSSSYSSTPRIVGNCDAGWQRYTDQCYYFNKDKSYTYQAASTACNGMGATLLIVDTKEEDAFVQGHLESSYLSPPSEFWIALESVPGATLEFEWSNGCQLTFNSWGRKAPSGDPSLVNCGTYAKGAGQDYVMEDKECTQNYGYICKKPAPVTFDHRLQLHESSTSRTQSQGSGRAWTVIDEIQARSLIRCTAACMQSTSCQALFYNATSLTCRFLQATCPGNPQSVPASWEVYVIQET